MQQPSASYLYRQVGSLASLPQKIAPHFYDAASRLATEKNILTGFGTNEFTKKSTRTLSFDIYGEKVEKEGKLRSLIDELGQIYPSQGHVIWKEIYKNYEVYLSASTSRRLWVDLDGSDCSGLPIIGLMFLLICQTFVTEDLGYLIPPSADQVVDQIASAFAEENDQLYLKR